MYDKKKQKKNSKYINNCVFINFLLENTEYSSTKQLFYSTRVFKLSMIVQKNKKAPIVIGLLSAYLFIYFLILFIRHHCIVFLETIRYTMLYVWGGFRVY